MSQDLERLRSIKSFPSLVKYLSDELDWPIESDEIEDLTFDYDPEELGLDPKIAVKIKVIKQLRPFVTGQPWGIFFVEFEKKKLPIVVLRSILSHLVLRKRASDNKSDAKRWEPDDLLFISAFGDEASDQREIAFAHFHQEAEDLPTLRVLGWDGADTPLKLEYVGATLRDKLHWPPDENDIEAWRRHWSSPFRHRVGHVIKTADMLAEVLAGLARRIRDAATTLLAAETEKGLLTKLYKGFQTALIHDLKPEDFADTYAQTITYGLLTAAISRTDMSGELGTALIAENVTDMVPITNPFLREMLQEFLKVGGRKGGIDFDLLGVQDVVELLRGPETDLPAVLRDFGNRTRGEDPVIHFYEHFLRAYNKKLKIQRGVFYTPQPVVSYIVRSVHELLRTEFGLEDGLASTITWGEMANRGTGVSPVDHAQDAHASIKIPEGVSPETPFVEILDPATGTATFLVEVIEVIYQHLKAKWNQSGLKAMPALPPTSFPRRATSFSEYWNQYVALSLLRRLHGYELMMAPYAIAHMKIGLKLFETGYRFGTEERARIYLTNALEPPQDFSDRLAFDVPALAHEAQAVNAIKGHQRFTVVVGNPPYSINSCNLQESAVSLVEPFRYVDGKKLQERGALKFETILQDDYVKFWGLGLQTLRETQSGIISMISNNGFLTNRVLRGIRKALLDNFTELTFLDLHGNRSKGEKCPDGSADDNVFDINQGVGISILRRTSPASRVGRVELADLWGKREFKYQTLAQGSVSETRFQELSPKEPYYAFALVDGDIEDEYRAFVALDEAMPFNKSGFVSGRDAFAVDFEAAPLEKRVGDFLNPKNSDAEVRERYSIKDAGGYALAKRRKPALAARLKPKDIIRAVQHRPFDYRFVAYSEAFLTSPQKAAMRQLVSGKNIALCLSRGAEIIRGWEHIFCTRAIIQHHTVSLKEVNYVFPLNVTAEAGSLGIGSGVSPNYGRDFLKAFASRLRIAIDQASRLPQGVTPEDIFHYTYAVFHSPGYRSRYAEFLKMDFPRLPLTSSLDLFRALTNLGGELVTLHLMESPKLDKHVTKFVGERRSEVEKISWSRGAVWLDKAQTAGFAGVPEEVWNFHIGGYQVCEKWLKDRRGRTLSDEDINHYQRIIVALNETIRLMAEIDRVIEEHGGWPLVGSQDTRKVEAATSLPFA